MARPRQRHDHAPLRHAYARRRQTVSEHQQRIGEYLRLRTFDTTASERLARFLEDEALRLDRTASLLARARGWLRDEHVLAPADSVLRRAVGAARHKARALLTKRMTESLSAPMRDRLDELVAVGADPPPTAASYTEAGLPWFEYYGGDVEALAAAPALAALDSVAAMTIKQGEGVGLRLPRSRGRVNACGLTS